MGFSFQEKTKCALIQGYGSHQGSIRFPRAHACVMANATLSRMTEILGEVRDDIFPPHRTILRDEMLQLKEATSAELLARLKRCFDPWWGFQPLSVKDVDLLRVIIHPEIIIDQPEIIPDRDPTELLRYLDLKQEQNARRIGEGHRILHGVAGSGKTVILIARVRYLAEEDPTKQILLLCYNVCLSAKLRSALKDYPSVTVTHFHGLGQLLGVHFRRGKAFQEENDEQYGARVLAALEADSTLGGGFDAVLIDEGQDFDPNWFRCAKLMLKDPEDGDLLIVADGNQGVYRDRRRLRWSEVGIQARGRTNFPYLNLHRNYRNTRPILSLAEKVLPPPDETDPEEGIACVFVDSREADRDSPVKPWIIGLPDREEEIAVIAKTAAKLLKGEWRGQPIDPIPAFRIAILYPRLPGKTVEAERAVIDQLQQRIFQLTGGTAALWVSDPRHWENRERVDSPVIRIQTVHSSKGLEFAAVILAFSDLFRPWNESTPKNATQRRLFYVGMTRPEDYLAITFVGQLPWIE